MKKQIRNCSKDFATKSITSPGEDNSSNGENVSIKAIITSIVEGNLKA